MELLGDFTTSLIKALNEIDNQWRNHSGLIIAGTHNPRDIDAMISKIKKARENNIPFLGICMGFQIALIEWARHLGHTGANTAEIDQNATPKIIVQLPTIRVGIRPVYWRGKESMESHWHNFAFARKHAGYFEKDWELSWTDGILEIARLRENKFHMGVQFHPEYESSKESPHFILKEFIAHAKMAA